MFDFLMVRRMTIFDRGDEKSLKDQDNNFFLNKLSFVNVVYLREKCYLL